VFLLDRAKSKIYISTPTLAQMGQQLCPCDKPGQLGMAARRSSAMTTNLATNVMLITHLGVVCIGNEK
jgi:hypothetical protein